MFFFSESDWLLCCVVLCIVCTYTSAGRGNKSRQRCKLSLKHDVSEECLSAVQAKCKRALLVLEFWTEEERCFSSTFFLGMFFFCFSVFHWKSWWIVPKKLFYRKKKICCLVWIYDFLYQLLYSCSWNSDHKMCLSAVYLCFIKVYNKMCRTFPRRFVLPLNITNDTPMNQNLNTRPNSTATAMKIANDKVLLYFIPTISDIWSTK